MLHTRVVTPSMEKKAQNTLGVSVKWIPRSTLSLNVMRFKDSHCSFHGSLLLQPSPMAVIIVNAHDPITDEFDFWI
jgi:hypothetical protein